MRRRGFAAVVAMLAGFVPVVAAQVPPLGGPPAGADLVLRRDDFIQLELMTLEDLLREQAGIAIGRRGGLGSPELLQVAGSLNGRVQLVLDGVEIAFPELEWPRLHAVQLAMVDSVAIWRTADPARIAIWTHHTTDPAPVADFDFGRGTLVSRTRRIQLFTPPRALTLAVAYDEVLRSGDDFRGAPTIDTAFDLGAYDNRSLLVRISLERGDDRLQVEHLELEDHSHGSFAAQSDLYATRSGRNALRWVRPLGAAWMQLDFGHQAWDHDRRQSGEVLTVTEARTNAALDVALPGPGEWTSAVRLRHLSTSGDRITSAFPGVITSAVRTRQDVEFELARGTGLETGVRAGAHRLEHADLEWSAEARAAVHLGAWRADARAGRGISFAGWGEADPTAVRFGVYGAAGLARSDPRTEIRVEAFGKSLHGGNTAPAYFPAVQEGPTRIGGLLGSAAWRGARGRWFARAATTLAWFPELDGDPAGMPDVQGRIDIRLGRSMRGGDLVVEGISTWRLDTQRSFATGPSIAPSAWGDVMLDIRVMQRADFFVGLTNWTDASVETYPGVLMPLQLLWWGARLRVLD